MSNKFVRSILRIALCGLLLACATGPARAATNLNVYTFDDEGSYTNDLTAVRYYGGYGWSSAQSWVLSWTSQPTNAWDGTRDADSNPGSGSLRQFYTWAGTGFEQAFDFVNLVNTPGAGNYGPIDGFHNFSYCAIDMRIDPSSVTNNGGNFGEYFVISITLRTNADLSISEDWDDVFRLNPSVADQGKWVTYKGTLPARQTNIASFFTGLQGNNFANGSTIINVDNLRFYTPDPSPTTNLVVYPFDNEGEYTNDLSAVRYYGGYGWSSAQSWVLSWTSQPTNVFDATQDANKASGSGSLKQVYTWAGTGFEQAFDFVNLVTTPGAHNYGPIDGFHNFSYCAIDMRIDPSSVTNNGGNFGEYFVISITLRTNADLSISEDWDDAFRLNPDPANVGRWMTYQGTLPARQTNIAAFFTGLQGNNFANGPTIINVDNLRFFSLPTPTGPQLTMEKVSSGGLEFVPQATQAHSDPGNFIMSAANVFTAPPLNWMSYPDSGTAAPTPVTYAMNISKFPDAAHSGFVAHMILAPYGTTPEGWRNHPENDLANVIYLTVTNNSDGSATAALQYKVNAPASSSNWLALATLNSPSPLGTWSVICDANAVTLKAPNAATAAGAMVSGEESLFNDGFTALRVWLGVQPRNANNWDQMAVFSSFEASYLDSVTGVNVITNENWSVNYILNWVEATDCLGILPRPANPAWRISWPGPATGFALQATNNLNSAVWPGSGLPIATSNTRKVSFVPADGLPGGNAGYYRLSNPTP